MKYIAVILLMLFSVVGSVVVGFGFYHVFNMMGMVDFIAIPASIASTLLILGFIFTNDIDKWEL